MHRPRSLCRLLSVFLVIALLAIPASTGAASPIQKPSVDAHFLEQVSPFLHVGSGGLVVDASGAIAAGVSKSAVRRLAADFDRLNQRLDSEGFDWQALAATRGSIQTVAAPTAGGIQPSATWGWNGAYLRVTLTEAETQLVIKYLNWGVSATSLAAALMAMTGAGAVAALAIGAIAAYFAFLANTLDVIDTQGGNRGIWAEWRITYVFVGHN